MQNEVKYEFQFRDNKVELSLLQVQQILSLLNNGSDAEFAVELLEMWCNEHIKNRNNEPTGTFEKQIEQERKQERGDD